MRQFLKSYLKEGMQFKASTAYMEFCASGQAADDMGRPITQKDFAMYLRTEVLKKDGLLKRTSHGVYEKRMEPDDQGITFPRKNHIGGDYLDDVDTYLDSIPVSQKDANLDTHPFISKLKLFMKWGIKFDQGKTELKDKADRKVYYAGKDTIIAAVAQAYPQQRETRGAQAKDGGTVISEQHTMKTPAKYWPTEAA